MLSVIIIGLYVFSDVTCFYITVCYPAALFQVSHCSETATCPSEHHISMSVCYKTEHFHKQQKKYSQHCCVLLCTAPSKCNRSSSSPAQADLRTRCLTNPCHNYFTLSTHTRLCSRHFTPDQLAEPKTPVSLLFKHSSYSPTVWCVGEKGTNKKY